MGFAWVIGYSVAKWDVQADNRPCIGFMAVVLYDLHTHSTASDGILSPESLVSSAARAGVQFLALTDHDTQQGIAAARIRAQEEGITLIPGLELSCVWRGRGVHVVGLGIDPTSDVMRVRLAAMATARAERAGLIARALARAGLSDENTIYQRALALADGGSVGRPHFARALVELGKVKSLNQAFKKYLGAGKPGDIKQAFPELVDGVAWLNEASGVAVLAHPLKYNLTRTKLRELLADFADAGGQAVEVISGVQAVADTRDMLQLAQAAGLAGSLGSDFHVPEQGWQALGCAGELPAGITPVWQLAELAPWVQGARAENNQV
ncbi:hypothetical protein M5M_00710 [Simiduia agarivorans SA1 = DSM 21679]|uniref:Polymerase/histidinol phosphatase N-terminal domain-containing protein n=2 Tax=Simiduia TaxID=447467 RepID=K4KTS4_SIMAS|nr:hypothetical protein M5M_00710 [Simiduia agarivorans SA1 = DSM 21679]